MDPPKDKLVLAGILLVTLLAGRLIHGWVRADQILLNEIYQSFDLGLPFAEAEAILGTFNLASDWTVESNGEETYLGLEAPPDPDRSQWKMECCFSEGLLVGKRVRAMNNPFRPAGGPKDEGADCWPLTGGGLASRIGG